MYKKLPLFYLLITLVLPSLTTQARQTETENAPLLISQDWRWLDRDDPDFWWWTGEQAEPFNGCVGDRVESELMLSPTQPLVAYLSTSAIWVPQMGEGYSGGDFPNDVLICNLATGEITEVAVQPENASVGEGSEWIYHSHSNPSWSPDGTRLAWTEYIGDNILQLMIYDLAAGTTATLIENLNPDGLVGLPAHKDVFWSDVGIGVDNFKGFEVYDANTGEHLNTVPFPKYSIFKFWITYEGKSYIGYNDTDNIWYLVDPLTGEHQIMPGLPELYSVAHPEGLAVRYEEEIPPPYNEITPPHRTPRWSVVDGDNVIALDYEGHTHNRRITLAPDGQSFAYTYENELWQWQAGQAEVVEGVEHLIFDNPYVSLIWTPMAWRVGASIDID